MSELDEFDLLREPAASAAVRVVPAVGPSAVERQQFEYEQQVHHLRAQLAEVSARLCRKTEEAQQTRQELERVSGEMQVMMKRKERATRALVQTHLSPLPSSLLYMDVDEFARIRAEALQARVDMLAGLSSVVAEQRLKDIKERHLTDFEVEQCLMRRKQVLEDKYLEEVPEGTPCEQVFTTQIQQKIQDAVLQLLRVLHRRRLSVLQGHKLPPVDSVFSMLPQ